MTLYQTCTSQYYFYFPCIWITGACSGDNSILTCASLQWSDTKILKKYLKVGHIEFVIKHRICSKTQSSKRITQHEKERKFSKKNRGNKHGVSILQYLAWNWRSVALLRYSSELSAMCFFLYRITPVRHSLLLVVRRMYKGGVLREIWSERCSVLTQIHNEQQSQ